MGAVDCEEVREGVLAAKEFFLEYRIVMVLCLLTILNVLIGRAETRLLRYAAFEHLAPEVCRQLSYRLVQLLLSPLLVLGYAFLVFNLATGCDASELYLFYGAIWLVMFDVHEYVRCWPLSPQLLGHHIMAFGIGACFTDLGALPAPGHSVDPLTMIFLSNVGICWASDFFHVVYRLSSCQATIATVRRLYFYFIPVRIFNIILLAASATRAALNGGWLGMCFSTFMCISYAYNTTYALKFMWNFNLQKYFETHQQKWLLPIASEPSTPVVADMVGAPSAITSGTSGKSVNSAMSGRLTSPVFKFTKSERRLGVPVGLRGDAHTVKADADLDV